MAGFIPIHPHRTAWDRAARRALWRPRMAVSPTPARRMRACQRSTSATPRRARRIDAMGSLAMKRIRPA